MFADQKYLDVWHATGNFPKIHDDMARAMAQLDPPRVVLDLGASTGLLTARARLLWPNAHVMAVDADMDAMRRGIQAGTYRGSTMLMQKLTTSNLPMFLDRIDVLLRGEHLDTPRLILARRIIPELSNTVDLHPLMEGLATRFDTMVTEARQPGGTHQLSDADAERTAIISTKHWSVQQISQRLTVMNSTIRATVSA